MSISPNDLVFSTVSTHILFISPNNLVFSTTPAHSHLYALRISFD
ncbi:hypothetical protein [Gardnerella sp. 2492]